jgi:hypothetical protein
MSKEQKPKSEEQKPVELPQWTCTGLFGMVTAATKSEARAAFKKRDKLKHLPEGAKVERV